MSPPPGEFDERAPTFQVGDVVYVEGASAIIGDVTAVDEEEGVTIAWRPTTTTEQPEDLVRAFVTKTGRVLTDAEIEALSDEAERGYDPADFERREP